MDTDKLLKEALDGNKDSYAELIKSIKSSLYRVARARLDNEDDVYDAIYEAILKSYQNLKKLRKLEYFKTWLIRILINECNKIYDLQSKNVELVDTVINNQDNYDVTIQNTESNLDFESMIECLNYDERMVFILYFYDKYKPKEIAKLLGTSINNVKSRLTRGKEKLRKKFKDGGIL